MDSYDDDVSVFDDPSLRFDGGFLVLSETEDPAVATIRIASVAVVLATPEHVWLDIANADPVVLRGSGTGSEPFLKHKEWAAQIHAAMVRHG